jgi:hypothetical protein
MRIGHEHRQLLAAMNAVTVRFSALFRRLLSAVRARSILIPLTLPASALLTIVTGLMSGGSAQAFPPAPSYNLYGMVRDQVGQTVTAEGAQIILLKDSVEIGRTPINSVQGIDQNYDLNVRIDQNRTGTTLYTDKAVAAEGLFSVAVEMNGARFYPIEVSGSLTAGKGAERVRLDLNLGEDSDGDGLPDVWEQWQLFQSGRSPDNNGRWPIELITKDGDFDGDGQSNRLEYVAGTFAGDATEFFKLEIKEKLADKVRFEFYGITGKTYAIERSTDNQTWLRIPVSTGTAESAAAAGWTASSVGVASAFVAATTGAEKEFFRLSVR